MILRDFKFKLLAWNWVISQHFSLGFRQVKDVHMHRRPKFRLICYKIASAEEKVVFHCLTLLFLYFTSFCFDLTCHGRAFYMYPSTGLVRGSST